MMSEPSDLITLATLKAWQQLPANTTDDVSLGRMISGVSRSVLSYINRNSLLPKSYTEVFDGTGKNALMLKNYPVTSITSLTVDGQTIPAAVLTTDRGYLLEKGDPEPPGGRQLIRLRGYWLNPGMQNVSVTYKAGYQISAEPAVAAASVTAQQPYGDWASDLGVVNAATGVALVKVSGAPAAGQYQLDTSKVGGYIFSAADIAANLNVLISYGFIPADLSLATLEWIADRLAYRGRVGVQSKTLGGQETVSFKIVDMPAFVTSRLQQFLPVASL